MAAKTRTDGVLRNERGGPMLEFALILPFATIMIFGIIQYGLIFAALISLRDAAWSTARYAMTINWQGTGTPQNATDAKTVAALSLNGVLSTASADFENPDCRTIDPEPSDPLPTVMYNCKLTYHYKTIFPVPGVGSNGRFALRAEATTK